MRTVADAPPPGVAARTVLLREDYELDLAPYARSLLRQWRLIVLCVALAIAAALVFALVLPRGYLGLAQVLISRPKIQFQIEPKLLSINDFELRPFFTHAKHPDVEKTVQTKLADQLPPADRAPGALIEKVTVRGFREDPALIEIFFTEPDERRASLLANAWAEVFVAHVQSALNPAAISQRVVEAQLRDAGAELQRREDAMRAFEQRTGLGLPLRDEVSRVELSAVVGGSGTATQSTSPSIGARLGTRGRDLVSRATTLAGHRAARDQTRLVLAQARALQSSGIGLGALSGSLVQLGVGSPAAPEAIVTTLEARDRAYEQLIAGTEAEMKAQEAALAADAAQLEKLERDRDLARDIYLTLAKKSEENKVGTAGDWPGATLFAPAPEIAPPAPRPWALIAAIALAAGLLVGSVVALVADRRTRVLERSLH